MARTIGSKNKPKTPFPVVDKKINDAYTKKEVDRLKNLVARQDDLIAQMLDELKQEQNKTGKLGQELEDLEDEINSWKEIVKTIMEVV
jgi:uncharacterized protein YlxW (UPF0749 family)